MLVVLVWVAALAAVFYVYLRRVYSSFSRAGVKCLPTVPLLGNLGGVILQQEHISSHVEKLYSEFPTERFIGRYDFLKPALVLRDLELLKKIAIKDTEYFYNHAPLVDATADTIFGRNLFNLQGQEWKDMRSTLSPAFTSSKMKLMVPLMVDAGNQMVLSLNKKIESNGGYVDVNVQDLATRYANDVIASCAFGTKVDSHVDVDNYFYILGKKTAKLGFREVMIIFGHRAFPTIMRMFKVSMLTSTAKEYYRNLVLTTMKTREENKIIRNDMIHLLMEVKKGKLKHENNSEKDADFSTEEKSPVGTKSVQREWSDEDIVAQAVAFFFAGFDTVSMGMTWILHELAVNPDIQDRLFQEIKENETKNGGNLDYNTLQEMKYLDMVVSETFRKWPPGSMIDRLCTKDYNFGKPNDKVQKDFILRKNQRLLIPIRGFHHDPQYFPEPHKFDPERFSDENKHKINPFAYIPFGLGPRVCIGSRFAICEIKIMVYMVLRQLEVSPCEKTSLPVRLDLSTVSMKMLGGHWLRFKKRN